jgi:hypothetical protein
MANIHHSVVHTYKESPSGKKDKEVPHINDSSTPLSIFWLHSWKLSYCWRWKLTATITIT